MTQTPTLNMFQHLKWAPMLFSASTDGPVLQLHMYNFMVSINQSTVATGWPFLVAEVFTF